MTRPLRKPWEKIRNQIYLGDEHFIGGMPALAADNDQEISRVQRRALVKSLAAYRGGGTRKPLRTLYDEGNRQVFWCALRDREPCCEKIRGGRLVTHQMCECKT